MTTPIIPLNEIKTRELNGILLRSRSFPLPTREIHEKSNVGRRERGNQADSCLLFEMKKGKIRIENARNEYMLAKGVKYNKDADERRKRIALVMLLRAARNGSVLALEELSDCYRRGIGTCGNETVAKELLKAFLRGYVERGFLEELLAAAYREDEAKEEREGRKLSQTPMVHTETANARKGPWLCFQMGTKQGGKRKSQGLFSFHCRSGEGKQWA